jgi:hypothetical protein
MAIQITNLLEGMVAPLEGTNPPKVAGISCAGPHGRPRRLSHTPGWTESCCVSPFLFRLLAMRGALAGAPGLKKWSHGKLDLEVNPGAREP